MSDDWLRLHALLFLKEEILKPIELTPTTMLPQIELLPGSISEILASSSKTGVLTLADRYGLMAATLNNEDLHEEEIRAMNRLLRAVSKGRVRVVDSLSTIRF